MRRAVLLLVAGLVAAAALAGTSSAAKRMFVGFQDDRSFQLLGNRTAILDKAAQANARIVRSFALWYEIAPRRPARAADPADPAYQFGRLDDLVRNANARGMDVLITIWGTPEWAGGGPNHNRAPKSSDIRAFAHAVAKRYSGSFQPIQSHSARPITSVWSAAFNQDSSSVNSVTHCRHEHGIRVMSVPQNMRRGPKAS